MTRRIVIINEFSRTLDIREGLQQVPVHALQKGDTLSGTGELVIAVQRGVRTPSGKSEVILEKNGYRRMTVWGSHTKVTIQARNSPPVPPARSEDGVGSPEEVAYGEGWHSTENANPYTSAAERASWERGRAAKKQKFKLNSNSRAGEVRGKSFQPPKKRIANDAEVPGWVTENIAKLRKQVDRFATEVKFGNAQKREYWLKRQATAQSELNSYLAEAKKYQAKDRVSDFKSEKGYVAKLIDVKTGGVLKRSEPHISNGTGLKKWIMENAQELIRKGKRVKAEVGVEFFDPNMMDSNG